MSHRRQPLAAAERERVATLNALITRDAQKLNRNLAQIRQLAAGLHDHASDMPVSQEGVRGFGSDDGPFAEHDLRHIAELAAEAAQLSAAMKDLVRLKLQLFGDCDFPGGDALRAQIDAKRDAIPLQTSEADG